MENFMENPALTKYFHADEDFRIVNIGYHNFREIKPSYTFRAQSFYTWHFITSGKGVLEMAGKVYHLGEGDMFFIPPRTSMRYFPEKDEPWDYVWLAVTGDRAAYYGALLGFSLENAVKRSGSFRKIKNILHDLLERIVRGEGGYYGVLSVFYEIVDVCIANATQTKIQRARELIDSDFTMSTFRIEALCNEVGFSHSHLLRLFEDAYGETPMNYLIRKRMGLARELLEETELPVRMVAYSCGFEDELHFMKCFKKRMGMTALAYRKAHKKQ